MNICSNADAASADAPPADARAAAVAHTPTGGRPRRSANFTNDAICTVIDTPTTQPRWRQQPLAQPRKAPVPRLPRKQLPAERLERAYGELVSLMAAEWGGIRSLNLGARDQLLSTLLHTANHPANLDENTCRLCFPPVVFGPPE
jgi:hypothetical protein